MGAAALCPSPKDIMDGPAPDDGPQAQSPPPARPAAGTRFLVLPQPRHWLLLGALLCAAVVVLGLSVGLLPGETAAELGVDQGLSLHHTAALTAVAMTINLLFGPVAGMVMIGLTALGILLVRRDLARAAAFALVACSGWVASEVFKLILARQRPDPVLLFDPLSPETGSNSFPSGHTCFAVALAYALYFLARGTPWAKAVAAAGAVMAVIVAWSRLYVGVHYPTDVAASFLAASAAVVLLAGLWNRFAPRLARRLPASFHPSSRSPRT
ncbi:phosphatase PAP2 family protein [Arthrobacter sp. OV608]|uniref:phosphatase PAP2 family protein n=1 Tax=Arthrobacter sp. OV608 TaxID=1882768 RepID=UPI0008B1E387|nr:phosphatase PAP2 family protein [Arthrobacter sp. OV608]SEP87486.1 undecaprenyl-diphosphatase [Arthrobacter sp. OV608]